MWKFLLINWRTPCPWWELGTYRPKPTSISIHDLYGWAKWPGLVHYGAHIEWFYSSALMVATAPTKTHHGLMLMIQGFCNLNSRSCMVKVYITTVTNLIKSIYLVLILINYEISTCILQIYSIWESWVVQVCM